MVRRSEVAEVRREEAGSVLLEARSMVCVEFDDVSCTDDRLSGEFRGNFYVLGYIRT